MSKSKALGIAGAVLLLATSGFHLTGLPMAQEAATEVTSEFFSSALTTLWWVPSVHWSILSIIAIAASLRPSGYSRIYLYLAAALLLIDAGMLFAAVGPFIGAFSLGACALLFFSAAKLSPTTHTAN